MTPPGSRGRLAGLAALLTVSSLLLAVSHRPFSIARLPPAGAADLPPNPLRAPDLLARLTPSSGQVTVARGTDPAAPGVAVTIRPGAEGYPGVSLHPARPWDLRRYGHVAARVVNTGTQPLTLALRLDNAGDWHDNPWDAESVTLAPGQAGTITTIFGFSYGHQPGYALRPGAVVALLLFAGKSDAVQSFRLESLEAGGPPGERPPVPPADVRLAPPHGVLLGAATAAASGAAASYQGAGAARQLWATFPGGAPGASVSLRPAAGRWDLRDATEVRVTVRNAGTSPAVPQARLESNGGLSDWVSAAAPLPPGRATVLVLPFAGASPADPDDKQAGSHLTSDAVAAVTLANSGRAGRLVVSDARADAPPAVLPAWLGKRPPTPGDWTRTLDDEFRGTALNPAVWDIYGANYWDKQSHWSKRDVRVGNGVVALRYERRTGPNNDDPSQPSTAYAAGYLHSYNKWTQRYGYFEARLKLPTAPGLWPAFWMMPDRGGSGPQWQRQDTANGGMEFDIMEHLDRWGPHRYNIALHYDGYGKDHKSVGSDKIYVQPDRDGFLTCGLLWTPGSAVFYCQGREVLHWRTPRIANVPEILMFTVPQGGWDNDPINDARLPDDFVVDYVRVWQRRDLAAAGQAPRPKRASLR